MSPTFEFQRDFRIMWSLENFHTYISETVAEDRASLKDDIPSGSGETVELDEMEQFMKGEEEDGGRNDNVNAMAVPMQGVSGIVISRIQIT